MNFINNLRYDLHQGTWRKWYLFLPPLLFSVFLCWVMVQDAETYQTFQTENITAGNLYANFFTGIFEYIPAPGIAFHLPLDWFLLLIYPLCLIGDYPVHDLKGMGRTVLLKTGSRKRWILSKLCGTACTATLYWATLLLAALLVGAAVGSPSLVPNLEILSMQFGQPFAEQPLSYFVFTVYGLPLLVILTSCILYLSLSIMLSPFFSILIITALKIAAAYYMIPLFPSEYTMLLRNVHVVSNGFTPWLGFCICAVLILSGILGTTVYFCHYDILHKKEV